MRAFFFVHVVWFCQINKRNNDDIAVINACEINLMKQRERRVKTKRGKSGSVFKFPLGCPSWLKASCFALRHMIHGLVTGNELSRDTHETLKSHDTMENFVRFKQIGIILDAQKRLLFIPEPHNIDRFVEDVVWKVQKIYPLVVLA